MAIPSPASIEQLPAEVLLLITNLLSNCELKRLRLASRFFGARVSLRIHRVFLSPNPRNIEVFLAIANHETLRANVVEIIYDDARLPRSAAEAGGSSDPGHYHGWDLPTAEEDNLNWFAKCREENIFTLNGRKGQDAARPDHDLRQRQCDAEMPLIKSWAYYRQLVLQQDEIIQSEADSAALVYALSRFSSLRRITITPAAHGFLFNPLYATPMIRAFPTGFNYPIPRGWPTPEYTEAVDVEALPWVGDGRSTGIDSDCVRAQWRGYSVVTRVLSEQQKSHYITEFIVDAHSLPTGLNCRIFEQPCDEYGHLVSIIRRPGFSHLGLSLSVGGQKYLDWPAFRSGLLCNALAGATDLKCLFLATDIESNPYVDDDVELLPLRTIFPVDRLARLQHFSLWNFLVQQSDLIDLLAALPTSLRCVELGFLHFLHERGNYRDLLQDMREKLAWHSWDAPPKVRIATYDMSGLTTVARAHWLEMEVENFLYCQGENPFDFVDGADIVRFGLGTLRDAFEPAYERPWLSDEDFRRLGIYRQLEEPVVPNATQRHLTDAPGHDETAHESWGSTSEIQHSDLPSKKLRRILPWSLVFLVLGYSLSQWLV